ncbi:hypothetical protein C8R44DRAFT_733196 [Mycena epipterygia]|nr:hypothetical protein C8R44DRAFT_733196 [Mycena epipterygia]
MPGIIKVKLNTSEESGLKSKQLDTIDGSCESRTKSIIIGINGKATHQVLAGRTRYLEVGGRCFPVSVASIHKPCFIPTFVDKEGRNLHPSIGPAPFRTLFPWTDPLAHAADIQLDGVDDWWDTAEECGRESWSKTVYGSSRRPLENPHLKVFRNVIMLVEELIDVSGSRVTRGVYGEFEKAKKVTADRVDVGEADKLSPLFTYTSAHNERIEAEVGGELEQEFVGYILYGGHGGSEWEYVKNLGHTLIRAELPDGDTAVSAASSSKPQATEDGTRR